MPHSGLRVYLRSLKVDNSVEGPRNSSSLGSSEPSFNRSSGRHQDEDRRNSQARKAEHQTEFTLFDDFALSKPPLSCFSLSSSYSGPVPPYCTSVLLLSQSKWNCGRHSIPHCSPFLEKFHIPAGHCSQFYPQRSSSVFTLVAGHHFLLCRAAFAHFVPYSEKLALVDPSVLSDVPHAERR